MPLLNICYIKKFKEISVFNNCNQYNTLFRKIQCDNKKDIFALSKCISKKNLQIYNFKKNKIPCFNRTISLKNKFNLNILPKYYNDFLIDIDKNINSSLNVKIRNMNVKIEISLHICKANLDKPIIVNLYNYFYIEILNNKKAIIKINCKGLNLLLYKQINYSMLYKKNEFKLPINNNTDFNLNLYPKLYSNTYNCELTCNNNKINNFLLIKNITDLSIKQKEYSKKSSNISSKISSEISSKISSNISTNISAQYYFDSLKDIDKNNKDIFIKLGIFLIIVIILFLIILLFYYIILKIISLIVNYNKDNIISINKIETNENINKKYLPIIIKESIEDLEMCNIKKDIRNAEFNENLEEYEETEEYEEIKILTNYLNNKKDSYDSETTSNTDHLSNKTNLSSRRDSPFIIDPLLIKIIICHDNNFVSKVYKYKNKTVSAVTNYIKEINIKYDGIYYLEEKIIENIPKLILFHNKFILQEIEDQLLIYYQDNLYLKIIYSKKVIILGKDSYTKNNKFYIYDKKNDKNTIIISNKIFSKKCYPELINEQFEKINNNLYYKKILCIGNIFEFD